jgi:glycosyltransferase involved in cell wall biosynthesis
MFQLQNALHQQGAEVMVLAFNTVKHPVDITALPGEYRASTSLEAIPLDNRVKPLAALMNIFSGESYNIVRFIHQDFEEALMRKLKNTQFDVVLLESLFMIPYLGVIREHSQAKVVLRAHNLEHLIWERLSIQEKNPLKKWYLRLLTTRLKRFEIEALNKVDGIAAMTLEDMALFRQMGCMQPLHLCPVGLNMEDYPVAADSEQDVVFHLGAMDWRPNFEGVMWFLSDVWPRIRSKVPHARLALAGKNMPQQIVSAQSDSIQVQGFVKDAKAFVGAGGIMVVPLFSGSGMRVKIVEGMAMGKAIVSTSIGAEGIGGKDKQDYILADTPETFAEAVVSLLTDTGLQQDIGKNARRFAEVHFDQGAIARKLLSFFNELT